MANKSPSHLDAGNIIYLLFSRSGLRLDYAPKQDSRQHLTIVVGLSSNVLGILKEARKFRFSFVMATVDFSDIDPKLVHALCNVGSLVAFKCGNKEAQILAREFDITPQDLQFIEKYHFFYLTPRDRGFAKAPSPPYIRKLELKKAVPPRKAKWKGWFPLESDLVPVPPMSG